MILLLMGVAGAGKTTIGQLLAAELGWDFLDADHFHPPANVRKMAQGIPLTDLDRRPWLRRLHTALQRADREGRSLVFACSALRAAYREQLFDGLTEARVVHLTGSRELLFNRLSNRQGHFMPATMLDSQFDTLESPHDALTVDVAQEPQAIVTAIMRGMD